MMRQALALRRQGRLEEAAALLRRAHEADPGNVAALVNLGNALSALGRHAEAAALYGQALAIEPGRAGTLVNLGNALQAQDRPLEAIELYDRALALAPRLAQAHNNRGNALRALNRHAEAIAAFGRALEINPELADAHLNEGLARLGIGDFAAGWPKYEWRDRRAAAAPRPASPAPRWRGDEQLAGKVILLHAEQGLGDTIQFLRYAPLVARKGARVIAEVQQPLKALAEGLRGVERVIAQGDPRPAFELQCSLLSLPLAFGTRLETIPAEIPYLAAAPERIAQWRARLGEQRAFRVGIVAAGRPGHRNDRNRSMPMARLAGALLAPDELELVSLQPALDERDARALGSRAGFVSLAGQLKDFSDTAAVVSLMDLVVSVDTAVAHLAGAMGKPVWILLPHSPDWRWLLEREDSRWYPSARLFRQAQIGDWQPVLERVRRELLQVARDADR
jgi:Tfp pilus assembly protein PilF